METADLIQTISVIVALLTFGAAQYISAKRNRSLARREIYQRLELASIELFRFEAGHLEHIRPIWEKQTPLPTKGTAERTVVMNYVCQMLNLFEMAIAFRKEKIMPPDVFGSWVTWYYTLLTAPHFAPLWEEMRHDYTPALRDILDYGVELLHKEWDDRRRRTRFFEHVGRVTDCDVVRVWLHDDETEEAGTHEQGEERPSFTPFLPSWCTEKERVDELVNFFVANVDEAYISYGEIMDGRAESTERWNEARVDVLRKEFLSALAAEEGANPKRVAVVYNYDEDGNKDGIAAMALAEWFTERQYAVLHDLIVLRKLQGFGIGSRLVVWLEDELKRWGVQEMYLESGTRNKAAHRFFKRQGFESCAFVMTKNLSAADSS